MIWVIIILAIIGIVLYFFAKDRDKMLQRQVDVYGGISKKYEYLIQHLTNYPGAKVRKVTRDSIHIEAVGQTTRTTYVILENFGIVNISWVGEMGMMGTHKQKWSFPQNYPQEKMIQEISTYMQWKSSQMFGL